MGLFGGKAEIALQTDRTDVVVGETLSARVQVGAPDKKVQGGRVELLYRNTYKYDDTDSDGDRVTRTRTVDVVVASVPLAGGGVPQAGEATVSLTVPANAPGTAQKSIEWQVRAVLDRRMGTDAVSTVPLFVRVPAAQLESWAAAPATSPAECAFAFDGVPRLVRPGDRISGTLSLRAAAPISARALEVRLRRVRYDKDDNTDHDTPAKLVVLDSPELAAGEVRALPFALDVPHDAPPSFYAEHTTQSWYLDAVFNRKLRSDIACSLQVVVHTA